MGRPVTEGRGGTQATGFCAGIPPGSLTAEREANTQEGPSKSRQQGGHPSSLARCGSWRGRMNFIWATVAAAVRIPHTLKTGRKGQVDKGMMPGFLVQWITYFNFSFVCFRIVLE